MTRNGPTQLVTTDTPCHDVPPPTSLSSYSRFVQRVRRRYATQISLLAPGVPGLAALQALQATQLLTQDGQRVLQLCITVFVGLPGITDKHQWPGVELARAR